MAELLKHIYNTTFFETYSSALAEVIPHFDQNVFDTYFTTPHWASLELKQRMAYLAHVTNRYLPQDYETLVGRIFQLIDNLRQRQVRDQNLDYIFLADIITQHGLEDLPTSIRAIEKVTSFTSFEFAGRAFIIRHPKAMMDQMLIWADHPNENVRRYASEGCRPRLPWGTKLTMFVDNPKPILPILEKLKDDPSLYVRKSVANNLNDISKDHPQIVTDIVRRWKGTTEHTDWIIKHGSRTLLKSGHPEVLEIFGNSPSTPFILDGFRLDSQDTSIGEKLSFSFILINANKETATFRVEYYVWYIKSNGQYSKKIFKIAEKKLAPTQQQKFDKTMHFKDLTTRKHYPGTHKISVVVNGTESKTLLFELYQNPNSSNI